MDGFIDGSGELEFIGGVLLGLFGGVLWSLFFVVSDIWCRVY